MKNGTIITIGRQCGSGGHEIGKKLAERLGVTFYDKELLKLAAQESGLAPENFEMYDEVPTNSLLYSLSLGNYGAALGNFDIPIHQKIFLAQFDAIQKLADRGESCVIIGRCADVILKDYHPLNLFIYADMEAKVERCIRRAPEGEHLTRNEIERMIKQVDKNRAQYRQMYSDTKWGAKESYHLCVNTTEKYIKEIVPGLAAYVRCWFSEE